MDHNFLYSIAITLQHEGGLSTDPEDPGGVTKYGLSQKQYPKLHIPNLTREAAIEIYYTDFWLKNGYERIYDMLVAAKVFDIAVNMGPGKAARFLQAACNRTHCEILGKNIPPLEIDGILGSITLKSVNSHKQPRHLVDKMRLIQVENYLLQNKPKYLVGWIRRAIS